MVLETKGRGVGLHQGAQAQPRSCPAPGFQTPSRALDISGPGDWGRKTASERELCGNNDDDNN